MTRPAIFLSSALVVGWLASTLPALGDLQSDVERVRLGWAASAKLTELRPRLLERGAIVRLFLPRDVTDPNTEACATVAVLGAPGTNFLLRIFPAEEVGVGRDWPEPSVAGAVQVTRCGARKSMLNRVAVEMRSPRGVLEFLVALSNEPTPSLLKTLPHRDPGPPGRRRDPGPRASLPPLAQRVQGVQEQNARAGGVDPYERKVVASKNGVGHKLFRLEPGCHRFDVLSEVSSDDERPVDIDVVIKSVAEQQLLGEDRSDNTDASVRFCIGRQEIVRLTFQGAEERAQVSIVLASWALPPGLPEAWGARARASMAEAVGIEQFPALREGPVFSSLGVQGPTSLPFEIVPGACYLVAVSAIRGATEGIAIAVRTGSFNGQNQSARESASTSLAFCADAAERGLLEVEAHGSGLGWLASVWQVGSMPVGEPHQ